MTAFPAVHAESKVKSDTASVSRSCGSTRVEEIDADAKSDHIRQSVGFIREVTTQNSVFTQSGVLFLCPI